MSWKGARGERQKTHSLLRKTRKCKQEQNPKQHRHHTLQNKNPPPPTIPPHKIHLPNRTRQQPTKRTRQTRARKEQAKALLRLLSSIPHSQQIKTPREHATLENSQKEPRNQQPSIILNQPLANRHNSKPKTANTQPNTRREPFQKDIRWNFQDDIRHEEDGQRRVKFHLFETQLSFETKGPGIGDVDAVEKRK